MSVASVWEIIVKMQRAKLPFPSPAGPYLRDQIRRTSMSILPVALDHALQIERLPVHHRDPFDRILIAQAIVESVPIVTADRQFARYDVETIW
jgi:PIN domain nuclease of toxin-antitoxin system